MAVVRRGEKKKNDIGSSQSHYGQSISSPEYFLALSSGCFAWDAQILMFSTPLFRYIHDIALSCSEYHGGYKGPACERKRKTRLELAIDV